LSKLSGNLFKTAEPFRQIRLEPLSLFFQCGTGSQGALQLVTQFMLTDEREVALVLSPDNFLMVRAVRHCVANEPANTPCYHDA
jgi:hypothetical protein